MIYWPKVPFSITGTKPANERNASSSVELKLFIKFLQDEVMFRANRGEQRQLYWADIRFFWTAYWIINEDE